MKGIRRLLLSRLDPKFLANKRQYLGQCLAGTLIVLLLLMVINIISSELVIASIASTTFVVFVQPNDDRTRVRYIFGGYVIGIVVGILCHYGLMGNVSVVGWPPTLHDELVGAIAVGVSIFLMVIFDFEHPPAASVALALVITEWNVWSVVVTLVFVLGLCIFRHTFANYLIDLD